MRCLTVSTKPIEILRLRKYHVLEISSAGKCLCKLKIYVQSAHLYILTPYLNKEALIDPSINAFPETLFRLPNYGLMELSENVLDVNVSKRK